MRLWSLSPHYLDKQGLCGLWSEAFLGESALLKGEFSVCSYCGGNGEQTVYPFKKCNNCKQTGKIKTPYYNHPQLERFKANKELSLYWITAYLYGILDEGLKRGYKFDKTKIRLARQACVAMPVTSGQLVFEFEHLKNKLEKRDLDKYRENNESLIYESNLEIQPHPLFKVVDGNVESWEKIKKEKI